MHASFTPLDPEQTARRSAPALRTRPGGRAFAGLLAGLLAGAPGVSCGGDSGPPPDPIAPRIRAHVVELSSDRMAGRAPGSPGGDAAAGYVEEQLRAAGLEPAGSDGYRQAVPLQGVRTLPGTELVWYAPQGAAPGSRRAGAFRTAARTEGREPALYAAEETFIAGWNRPLEAARVEGEMVFVGYGVVDGGLARDDFAGAELEGRWAVALDGAPPGQAAPLPHAATQPVAKLVESARRGAVGLLLLSHVDAWPEPYDLARGERVLPAWGPGERGQPIPFVALRGALVDSISGGRNLWQEAIAPGFRPRPLAGRLEVALVQEVRRFEHPNLLARLPGRDPVLARAHVCLSAHYDGLGRSPDGIYRGVVDNAIGVAELIEAAALARREGASRRSLLFLFPTGEESGLLGSRYFVENPTVPLEEIVGCLNKDGAPEAWGRATDVVAVAAGASPPFAAALRAAVERLGLAWNPNPFPAEGFFFRSDHYAFLRAGVPGVLLFPGLTFQGRPPWWGVEQAMLYLKDHYHRTSDDLSRVLDWDGPAAYARLWLALARELADGPEVARGEIDLHAGD